MRGSSGSIDGQGDGKRNAVFPLTRALADWISDYDATQVSSLAAAHAQMAILDTLGVMFAGRTKPAVAHIMSVIDATLGQDAAPSARALVFGTAAHSLDYDDVAFGGHVSAVIVPAILALLPVCPGLSGRQILAAYIAGYEAWAEVSSREASQYHIKGAHPTGLLGPIGAAAASAVMLGLNAVQTSAALGIASSLGAGLNVNFGTMTKAFHAGRAAEAGVTAALLARAGMTSANDALEASNGFLAVHSPDGKIDLESALFLQCGSVRLEKITPNVKRFPVCYAAHRAVDAALALHHQGVPDVDEILQIDVILSRRHSEILRFKRPTTTAEAQFSLEHCVACALMFGRLELQDIAADGLTQPKLRQVADKIGRTFSKTSDQDLDGFASFDQVMVRLHDGSILESPKVIRALGHADNPMSSNHVAAKAEDCMRTTGMAEVKIAALLKAVENLADDGPVDEFCFGLSVFISPRNPQKGNLRYER